MDHSSHQVHRNLSLLCFGVLLLTLSGCQGYQNFYWYVCKYTGYYTPACTRPPALETHLFPEQPVPSPSENRFSPDRAALGKKLFFDPILSRNGTVSCASCHKPQHAYADPKQFSTGIDGQQGSRNSPGLLNVAYQRHFFFDGRTGSLEQQAREPMFNSKEMGNLRCTTEKDADEKKSECKLRQQEELEDKRMREAIQHGDIKVRDKVEEIADRLKALPEYGDLFKKAFDHDIKTANPKETFALILQAIASFERTLTSTDALFDRWVNEEAPISWDAQKGWKLFFGKARCSLCHIPPTYSDGDFHNLGVARVKQDGKEVEDKGRASFLDQHPQSQAPGEFLNPLSPLGYEVRKGGGNFWEPFGMDACAYKTPSLRNVEHTQPYMHTGGFDSLEQVVKFYVAGGGKAPCGEKDWRIQKLDLDETEQGYIVEFLKTLSGTKVPAGVPEPSLK